MACDDHYVYVYEDAYSSDDEDLTDALVTGIVADAFRQEDEEGNQNTNPHFQDEMCTPTSSDIDASLHTRHQCSEERFPTITIMEITDEGDTLQPASNGDVCDSTIRRTVSEGTLPEKTVRFTAATPTVPRQDKKTYPTTPKYVNRNLGPSLSPLKPQANDSSSFSEDQTTGLTCLGCFPESPGDTSPHNSSPCSPAPLADPIKDAEAHMVALEENLIKLNCVLAHVEDAVLLKTAAVTSDTQTDSDNPPETGSLKDDVKQSEFEQDFQDVLDLLQGVNMKWTIHKKNLEELLNEAERREEDHVITGKRAKQQKDLILKLKHERRALELCLEDREFEWMTVKKSIRADSNYLKNVLREAEQSRDTGALWRVLDSLLHVQFDREKAIAMDSAKQNKINELHLLICRQQLHLAEVEERNRQLAWELKQVTGHAQMSSRDCNASCLADVLYCDHTLFMPNCSTNPEFATLQTYRIGGTHANLRHDNEHVFDGSRLYSLKGDRWDTPQELAEYDHAILKELTETGPGSRNFRFEETSV
ncbi:uncharacterized protein [Haliotis cracherodii]|uniref:uncharacterized protein n=1 Tax=Haliotis cracherodii TaxID=6455 RepID=UPI0039EA0A44